MEAKRGSKSHSDAEEVVKCLNPDCGEKSDPGLRFCDECLMGMLCFGNLSVFKMGLVQREAVPWDRT